ncbi:MAG: hypothetical protein HY929_01700 [Euryarchaeota archaeon]|nr:hypothetical protein [Euryarchaeota archaeon]
MNQYLTKIMAITVAFVGALAWSVLPILAQPEGVNWSWMRIPVKTYEAQGFAFPTESHRNFEFFWIRVTKAPLPPGLVKEEGFLAEPFNITYEYKGTMKLGTKVYGLKNITIEKNETTEAHTFLGTIVVTKNDTLQAAGSIILTEEVKNGGVRIVIGQAIVDGKAYSILAFSTVGEHLIPFIVGKKIKPEPPRKTEKVEKSEKFEKTEKPGKPRKPSRFPWPWRWSE